MRPKVSAVSEAHAWYQTLGIT